MEKVPVIGGLLKFLFMTVVLLGLFATLFLVFAAFVGVSVVLVELTSE